MLGDSTHPYQDPNKVVVTCYGPEATNIHGVDESVSLDSMKEVMGTIALFRKVKV